MKARTGAAAQPKRVDFYDSMAQEIETIRLKTLERAGTDPQAALVAHALLRARSAAIFAGRCEAGKEA